MPNPRPRTKAYAWLVLGLTLSCVTPPLRGQEPAQGAEPFSWGEMMVAPTGTMLKIVLHDGAELKGRLASVDADAIVIKNMETGRAGVKDVVGSAAEGYRFRRSDIATIEVLSRLRAADQPTATSFNQLSMLVRAGDTISVNSTKGLTLRGKVVSLSPSLLKLQVGDTLRNLEEVDVATVRHRRQDSLKNGALVGGGVGAATGMVACGVCHAGPGVAMAALFGGIGAGIGVGIDALITGNVVVYQGRDSARRVTVVPQLAKSHKGVAVSVTF